MSGYQLGAGVPQRTTAGSLWQAMSAVVSADSFTPSVRSGPVNATKPPRSRTTMKPAGSAWAVRPVLLVAAVVGVMAAARRLERFVHQPVAVVPGVPREPPHQLATWNTPSVPTSILFPSNVATRPAKRG